MYITENNRDIIDFTINKQRYGKRSTDIEAYKILKNKILQYLSGEERKLIYMLYTDGCSVQDIADKMKISPDWVHKKIRKLKADIKQIADALILYDLSVLSDEQKAIYEMYYCYRNSIQFIANTLKKDRRIISNEIKIIEAKLGDKLSQTGKQKN